MKRTTFTNLLILSTLTLFTACSNTAVKPKKEAESLHNINRIMGIQESTIKTHPRHNMVPVPVTLSIPLAETFPMENSYFESIIDESYTLTSNIDLSDEIEWHAKQLLGIKYVWGATGPYTYDCSGFTQKIYRDAGINIPRVSRDQAKVGEYLNFNQLRRGDMVFFDTKRKRTGIVSHVGIYLGDGDFIHASSSAKKIVIYNFEEKNFYKKRFLWGRRVIQDNTYFASL